jgi:hypothetical protein
MPRLATRAFNSVGVIPKSRFFCGIMGAKLLQKNEKWKMKDEK